MKTAVIFVLVLAACLALLLFAKHHHRRESVVFKACTLGEIYGQLFREGTDVPLQKMMTFYFFGMWGMVAVFYPCVLVLMVRLTGTGSGTGVWYVVGGLLAMGGACVNFLAMIVSHMNFGFGASQSRDETAILFVLPGIQIGVGVASVLLAILGK